jgi:hypothetical protein
MQVKIDGPKTITFTPQGISYVLDMLANCPWKVANPLINDIMSQLKAQEGGKSGSEFSRSDETPTGRGNSSPSDRRVSTLEVVSPDHRTEDLGGYSCDDPTPARTGTKGA